MFASSDSYSAAIAVIEKCGSQSINNTVVGKSQGYFLSNEEALLKETRVMFIREPIERVKSAFSMVFWLTHYNQEHGLCPSDLLNGVQGTENELADYHTFIDYIFLNDDTHWTSQVEQVSVEGVFVPNMVHKFDVINERWGDYAVGEIPKKLPHDNAYTPAATDDYRLDELLVKYADDVAAYKEV